MDLAIDISGARRHLVSGMDADSVLRGPGAPDKTVEIDDVFAAPFSGLAGDILTSAEVDRLEDVFAEAETILRGEGIDILEIRGADGDILGVAARCVDDGHVLGAILGPALAVSPESQGAGIGRALVAAELLSRGRLAVWDLDEVSYSPIGMACVRSGLRMAQEIIDHSPEVGTTP